ncbi:hypothetical protein C8R45DRAFT_62927 [Mycena sanguinolenta]|nr:hypothetical protein C8R45DRAFT_62927 [Mycena sanguinolenta]
MHRCLQIPEIVDMICAELDPFSSWSFTSHHLAILARTCTSFSGPALHHLWACATLSKILISCMPSDLWADDVTEGPGPLAKKKHEIRQLRAIRESDWVRVKFYGHLVKHLSYGPDRPDHWSLSSVFPALSASFPDGLFPNLQTLRWHPSKDDFHFIHLFLRPTITKISLRASSDADSFSTVATKCPRLIDVSVSLAGYDNSESEPLISEFVRSLQCVQKISAPSLDQKALEHISRLTTLDKLTLFYLPKVWTPIRQGLTFSTLQQLTLICPEIGTTTEFLGWCSQVPLVDFSVYFRDLVARNEIDSFFAAVSTAFLRFSLTKLSIHYERDDAEGTDPDIHLISFQSLRHIFSFVNLTELTITSLLGFDLDNDAMAAVARAWPQIVTLRLAVCFPGHIPRATLPCLHSFAQHCPQLRRLTVALDARVVPISFPDIDPRTRVVQRTLATLHVEHSPLVNPFHAARFLTVIFPNLAVIRTQREFDANDTEEELEHGEAIQLHRMWKAVEWLLPEICSIREEGKMLARAPSAA